jgi:hypothetical protein
MEERAMRYAVLIAAFMLTATMARAQDPMQMDVVGYGKIPAGASFQTELTENSEIANQVDNDLKTVLSKHGFRHSDDAGLVFTITADTTGRDRSEAALAGENLRQDNAQVHITLNTLDKTEIARLPHTYRISLALYDRKSGHYVWRGEITNMRPDADPFGATSPMLEQLVTAMEKSVALAN